MAVQGAACAPEVARAIEGFNALPADGPIPRPDLLIVARGGGSIEDLWGFNEEAVVRAAAASAIPLISAVGHETDTTLIDHAADRRAPTPTAAAEMAVPVRRELMAWAEGQGARMSRALNQGVTRRSQRLRDLSRALPRPEALAAGPRQRLDVAGDRLAAALRRRVADQRQALIGAGAVLRPSTLRARNGQARQQLRAVTSRLSPQTMKRTARRRRERLDMLARILGRDAALRVVRTGRRDRLQRTTSRFTATLVDRLLAAHRDRLTERTRRVAAAGAHRTAGLRHRLDTLERVRITTGYEATLARGYAVVWQGDAVVTSANAARQASTLEVQFTDGRVAVSPGETPPAGKRKPGKRSKADRKSEQGTLF